MWIGNHGSVSLRNDLKASETHALHEPKVATDLPDATLMLLSRRIAATQRGRKSDHLPHDSGPGVGGVTKTEDG